MQGYGSAVALFTKRGVLMRKGIVRPLVICVFRFKDSILVAEGYDDVKKEYYYRPIGGGIEYGEHSSEALIREVREELQTNIYGLEHLGTLESIFTYNGEIGHEIVFVYDGKFSDHSFHKKDSFVGKEDNGTEFTLHWKPINEFREGKLRLVPDGLLSLIH
jgi:8-oxo-dGTP pyrophosphatase MutT (NUDIX family)